MPDVSPRLALPLILPAQAQKHVTHNEALDLLDLLVQTVVESFDAEVPPGAPSEGQAWALGAAPTGAWSGQALRLASWRNGAWLFVVPQAGWRAWGRDTGALRVFSGSAWEGVGGSGGTGGTATLGINTTADATNRLAVAAAATLLTHEGAGHQLKINKAAVTDTASLLFQSGWSGRAEMGLAGSDAFAIKVSGDGATFATALSAAPDGTVTLPGGALLADGLAAAPSLSFAADPDTGLRRAGTNQLALVTGGTQRAILSTTGLQISVPVTGTAVQSSALDGTAGRLLTAGAFGLGSTTGVAAPSDDANLCIGAGLAYRFTAAATNTPGTPYGGSLIVSTGSNGDIQQLFLNREGTRAWLRGYSTATSAWSSWQRVITNDLLVGTVTQSAGVPTGAIVERGSNANGAYVRFADGTQICTRADLAAANASTADGALYRSADVAWTFPAVFAEVPVVAGGAGDTDTWVSAGAPSTTTCSLRVKSSVSKAGGLTLRVMAQGRWF